MELYYNIENNEKNKKLIIEYIYILYDEAYIKKHKSFKVVKSRLLKKILSNKECFEVRSFRAWYLQKLHTMSFILDRQTASIILQKWIRRYLSCEKVRKIKLNIKINRRKHLCLRWIELERTDVIEKFKFIFNQNYDFLKGLSSKESFIISCHDILHMDEYKQAVNRYRIKELYEILIENDKLRLKDIENKKEEELKGYHRLYFLRFKRYGSDMDVKIFQAESIRKSEKRIKDDNIRKEKEKKERDDLWKLENGNFGFKLLI